jgi:hypothetical protein
VKYVLIEIDSYGNYCPFHDSENGMCYYPNNTLKLSSSCGLSSSFPERRKCYIDQKEENEKIIEYVENLGKEK